jgi:TetR/AcrR family transcriptional regulator, regulator of cefoperazone and chloramphenicol sensitivity
VLVPCRGRGKPESQKAANSAHARLRSPGERANGQLKAWHIGASASRARTGRQPTWSFILPRGRSPDHGPGGAGLDARQAPTRRALATHEQSFTIVNMSSLPDDRTSRAVIRDEALRLFADRGPDAVTIRDVASAAGVSPALVIRHYQSKDGLREAVDDHVARLLEAVLADMTASPAGPFVQASLPTLAGAVTSHLPPDSPVPAYLGRMLIGEGAAGARLFRRLHAVSEHALAGLTRQNLADDGGDPPARAAFLLANDLAVLILRNRLADVLGTDPLSPGGIRRWAAQVLSVYGGGLAARPGQP